MKIQQEKTATAKIIDVRRRTIEGVVIINGRPQIERADMPLTISFDSIEELERFCKKAKGRSQNQH